MSSNPSSPHSSRLENLNLGSRGAAFELDGRPVRLDAEGYAAPVASFQEFYHQALADFYQRSAEITRQQAAARPPLLGRLISWIGGLFGRSASAPPLAGAAAAGPPPTAITAPAAPAIPAKAVPRPPEVSLHPPAPPSAEVGTGGPPVRSTPESSQPSPLRSLALPPPLLRSVALPPALAVVFADQEGVHVIWQLAPAKADSARNVPERTGAKANTSRLELTYSLDSALAQRLQDCYGQLAQLGYKIAGLDAVRATPEKSAAENSGQKSAAGKTEPKSAAERIAASATTETIVPVAAAKPSSRKPRPEATPSPTEPEKLRPELPPRDPSFLPGI